MIFFSNSLNDDVFDLYFLLDHLNLKLFVSPFGLHLSKKDTFYKVFAPCYGGFFENLWLNFPLSENFFCQLIFSVIAVAVPPVFSSGFHIQHGERLDAMHLLIPLRLPLRVLPLKENVTSCLRDLPAKICHPI